MIVIEKPEGYESHQLSTSGNYAVLMIYTNDSDKPELERIGESYAQFEVEELEDELLVREVA